MLASGRYIRPKLYYFGRNSLWLFLLLLLEGIALHLLSPFESGLGDAPASVLSYISVMKIVAPGIALFGVAAAIGLMHQRNWARHLMSIILGMGCVGAIIVGAAMISEAMGASESAFAPGTSKTGFMIGFTIVILTQVGLLGWCIWHLSKNRFHDNG